MREKSLAAASSLTELIARARHLAEALEPGARLHFFALRAGRMAEIEPLAESEALVALAARALRERETLGAGLLFTALEGDVLAISVTLARSPSGALLCDAIALALRDRPAASLRGTLDTIDLLSSGELDRVNVDPIVGHSRAIRRALALLVRVAPTDVPVLLTGESGTGKEVFARALHRASPRAAGPFVAVNCAAIPAALFEAELFGYRRGAFSGAVRDHQGHARSAHGGTLLLDEVGELSPDAQSKLLRFLEDRQVQALGDDVPESIDVRVVCATNRDLAEEVAEGRFREDLYYRINVVEIGLPPLRQRREDIRALAQHLLASHGGDPQSVAPESYQLLERYFWPGNVRELDNVLRRALALAGGGAIEPRHLSRKLRESPAGSKPGTYADQLRTFKRTLVVQALADCEGNQSAAARRLDISRQHLRQLMAKLDIAR